MERRYVGLTIAAEIIAAIRYHQQYYGVGTTDNDDDNDAAAIIGGLALGAIIGGALAQPRRGTMLRRTMLTGLLWRQRPYALVLQPISLL